MKKDFQVKDYSVSGELFRLRYDEKLHMFFTEPKPAEKEISRYYESENYISHTDGKRSLFESLYQVVKRITLSRKQKLISKHFPKKGRLLDIGAGTGDFLSYAKEKGWSISGVEPSEKARGLAKEKGIVLKDELPEGKDPFDVVTMWHVLEHVYNLGEQLKWLKDNLNKDGVICIAVPNFESYDAQYYKNYWAAYDVPRHLYHFSPKAIEQLAEEHGLQVIQKVPMKFDAYYVSLLSEKYKKDHMNFLSAFYIGLRSNMKARRSGAYSSLIYVIKHTNNQNKPF